MCYETSLHPGQGLQLGALAHTKQQAIKSPRNKKFHFYAPPTIVEGHHVFWSVCLPTYNSRGALCSSLCLRLFVHPSVPLQVKVLVKNVSSVQFHGPLNIENESGSFRLKFLVKVVLD